MSRSHEEDRFYAARFKRWHWHPASAEVPIKLIRTDPDYPARLIECGRLAAFYIERPGEQGHREIEIGEAYEDQSHVGFDPHHKHQRLYAVTPAPVRAEARRLFWHPHGQQWDLNVLAAAVGGKHGRAGGYPALIVQPVGKLTDVVYFTEKVGDGPSYYVHAFGEESGVTPWLAVDAKGRFWIAGGNFSCPSPGVTD